MFSFKNAVQWFVIAKPEVINQRRSHCNECEVRDPLLDICTACHCFIPAKVRLKKSQCPLLIWEK